MQESFGTIFFNLFRTTRPTPTPTILLCLKHSNVHRGKPQYTNRQRPLSTFFIFPLVHHHHHHHHHSDIGLPQPQPRVFGPQVIPPHTTQFQKKNRKRLSTATSHTRGFSRGQSWEKNQKGRDGMILDTGRDVTARVCGNPC